MDKSTTILRASSHSVRKFFEDYALRHGIRTNSAWGRVTSKSIQESGGRFLSKYDNSLFKSLQSNFPETIWERSWFRSKRTKGFWAERNNHKVVLDEISILLDIKEPKEWSRVSASQIAELGYASLLTRYNYSIKTMLKTLLPHIHWESSWFPRPPKNWKNKEVQRKFLDNLASEFHINNPKEWGKLTIYQVEEKGGASLLSLYGNSLFNTLQAVYNETTWKREWFPNIPKYHLNYWNSLNNQRKFLNSIASDFGIETANDWRRITVSLIRSKGGNGLLSKYMNSLVLMLDSIYPEMKNQERNSNPQKRIARMTSFILQ